MPDLEVIVPVLNEQDSIQELVSRVDKALTEAKISYGLIFVDDHSTDNTVKEIKKLESEYPIRLHKKTGERGKAYSILEGASLSSAARLAMIDGDLQYPPEILPEMYSKSMVDGIVVANRRKKDISVLRKIGSDASTEIVGKLLLGLDCDVQSGLKLFKREIIEEIDTEDVSPWALDMPLLHTARDMGESIGGVDIDFSERAHGKSKVRFFKTAREIASNALKLKFKKSKPRLIASKTNNKVGAGVSLKKKKFITHTELPHNESALSTFVAWQKNFIFFVLVLFFAGLYINYLATLIFVVAVLSTIYFADVLFSLYVLLKSLHFPPEFKFSKKVISALDESELPIYTVLCPLYKEGSVLPEFIDSMSALDWPKEKLEVLILLEEDDDETLSAAKKLKLPKFVKIVIVPDSQPRTKPKACNYGLLLAKGEYVVVYDAEDRPDPLQLKKSYLGFQKLGEKSFCLQSKLNYFNPDHNILTRLFTAEYSLWFDIVLPGLQSIESSIPLGGTSNHFRVKALIDLHAWDPFNVTEDCDLGVRIFKAGYKTAIIDSTTLEEANSSVKNWIRQRSRWIKGYMQTYLVHMRTPRKFFKDHGSHAVIFQLIIGMRMTFMIINPFLWVMTVAYFALRSTVGPAIESLYPAPVFYMAAFALVVGNFLYLFNYMIGCAKRGHYGLIKFIFVIPLYWILASVAAFKALHQLIVKPHYWEKTNHGLHKKKGTETDKSLAVPVSKTSFGFDFVPKYRKEFLSGGILIVASVLVNVLNFGTSAYLGRILTPEEFALIALLGSFIFLVQVPSSALAQTVAHDTSYLLGKFGKPVGEIWTRRRGRIMLISAALCAVWLVFTPALSIFFKSESIIPLLVFAPSWIFLIVRFMDGAYIYGNMKFHILAAITVLEAVAKLAFSVMFVLLGLNEWVYAALPISLGIAFIAMWIVAKNHSNNNLGNIRSISKRAKELKFSTKFFFASMLTKVSSVSFLSVDLIFVTHYLSGESAGQYALLTLMGRMVYLVGGLFAQFILPIVSHNEGKGSQSDKSFYKLLFGVFVSAFSVFLFVGPFGSFTMPILFGNNAYPILTYLIPFSFSMVLFTLSDSLVTFHLAKKRYIFSVPGILTLVLVVSGLTMLHENIAQIVFVMLMSSAFYLISSLLLQVTYERANTIASNILDFVGLFVSRFNGKNPLPNGKLRILIYNWRDKEHVWAGGAEVYVHELAKRWVEDGNKVTLFCGNDGQSARNEKIDGVNIYRRGGFYTVYIWAFLYYLLHFRRRYDVVVESENGAPFFTPLYSTKPKVLIVHHVHQEIFRQHLRFPLSTVARFTESTLMPIVYRGKAMIAVSESTKKDLIKSGIAKGDDVHVISPGVDLKLFNKFKKTINPTFVYIGRHKAYKNIDVAIRAFGEVVSEYPKAKFRIAGEGENTAFLKQLVSDLGLAGSVSFLGKVDEEQKVQLLGESWVAVQPSSIEGWGITVIEANACATPVIASKVSGLRDSVLDGKTGILVPPKDILSMRDAMLTMISKDHVRRKMSREAFLWSKNHDWDYRAKEFINVIVEIKNNRGNNEGMFGDLAPTANYSYEEK